MPSAEDRAPRFVRLRVRGCGRTAFTLLDILLLAAVDPAQPARIATYGQIASEIGCYPRYVRTVASRLERAGLIATVEAWREDGGRDGNAWMLTDTGRAVLAAWPAAAGQGVVDGLPEWARGRVGVPSGAAGDQGRREPEK